MAHDHSAPSGGLGGRLLVSMLINVLIFAAQMVGGVLSGSLALITDALHNVSDVAALGLSYGAWRLGRRPADQHYTFAFRRAEVIAAVVNAVALVGVALYVGVEAVGRILHPQPVAGGMVMAFAAFGAVANGIAALLIRGHGRDLNLRSAMLHLVSDSVASVGVLLAGLVIRLTSLYVVDPIVSLVLAAWMISESWKITRNAARILMQGVPEDLELEAIHDAVVSVDGVESMHDLRVWSVSSDEVVLSAHLVVDRPVLGEATVVTSEVKRVLHDRFGVEHATIETECAEGGCAGAPSCGIGGIR
jgi:cobalt-zinc-cadmium efflux system protein